MPGGEIGGEEQAAEHDQPDQRAGRDKPVLGAPAREQEQERGGKSHPPEACRDRTDIGQPDHPRAGGEDEVREDQRREGERPARAAEGAG